MSANFLESKTSTKETIPRERKIIIFLESFLAIALAKHDHASMPKNSPANKKAIPTTSPPSFLSF